MNDDPRKSIPPADDAGAPFAWARESGLGGELARETRALVRRRRQQLRVGAAAALSLLLVAAALTWRGAIDPTRPIAADRSYKVATPERRVLPDGSRVDLNADSAIAVEYSAGLRRVVLVRGEALFDVAKDSTRPFVVTAAGAEVRALGTVFSVARDQAAVDVMVTEGRVAVKRIIETTGPTGSSATAAAASIASTAIENADNAVTIDAGNGATLRADDAQTPPSVRAVSREDVRKRLAWRVPRLAFEGTPLAEVVRLFGEHGDVTLTIADPTVRAVKVSGILRADNTAALLQLLADDHGIEADPVGTGFALRRRR